METELGALRETDQLKNSILDQLHMEMGQYKEEVAAWEAEYDALDARLSEFQVLMEKEGQHTQERVALMTTSADSVDQMAKESMSLKVSLQKVISHAEQESVSAGGQLEEGQEREVSLWRMEREKSRKEVCTTSPFSTTTTPPFHRKPASERHFSRKLRRFPRLTKVSLILPQTVCSR